MRELYRGGLGGVLRTKVVGIVRAYSTHRLDHSPTIQTGLECWKFHCGGLLPMEMPTDAAFGRATMPTARAPGVAANRAGPSRSFGAGRRPRVPGGSGSRGCRLAVYWVVGPTAASRRRPAASLLGHCTGCSRSTDALSVSGLVFGMWSQLVERLKLALTYSDIALA